MRFHQFAFVAALWLSAVGCVDTAAVTTAVRLEVDAAGPVKVVLLQDQTGSSGSTRTEVASDGVLRMAATLLGETGGELLVGTIRDSSNLPLERMALVAAPVPPPTPDARNAFDMIDAVNEYEARLVKHKEAAARWETDFETRTTAFVQRVGVLLQNSKLSRRSAVWEAVSRADLALAEPEADPAGSSAGHRYIVLASDCQDTTGTAPRTLQSGAAIVVANGAGALGSFANVDGVQRFENLQAAVNWVVQRERSRRPARQ